MDNENFRNYLMYRKYFYHEYGKDVLIRDLVLKYGKMEAFRIWYWHYQKLMERMSEFATRQTTPFVIRVSQEKFDQIEKTGKLEDLT
ncbi:MAG: hypothetical protein V3U54_13380 [Thermodesulfobacteriota bacterium]